MGVRCGRAADVGDFLETLQPADWEVPEVYGTAEALLLVITGRPVGREELTGPGAPALYERLT